MFFVDYVTLNMTFTLCEKITSFYKLVIDTELRLLEIQYIFQTEPESQGLLREIACVACGGIASYAQK